MIGGPARGAIGDDLTPACGKPAIAPSVAMTSKPSLAASRATYSAQHAMTASSEADHIRRLLNVGRALVAEHDTEAVLDRILNEARQITGARYAALGVLDETRQELERFLALGFDPETRRAIGDLPRGRGVLGVLIHDPRPLRLTDVGEHPHSYGFPPEHPEMRTFLGVPLLVRGQVFGNLYMTEKRHGEFTAQDEAVLTHERVYNALIRTTCTTTQLKGSPQDNVLPTTAEAVINCRILPGETIDATEAELRRVIADDKLELSRAEDNGQGGKSPSTESASTESASTASSWVRRPWTHCRGRPSCCAIQSAESARQRQGRLLAM